MFQYAAGRSIAIRNKSRLFLDTQTGFNRDKVFRRNFELGQLPIKAMHSGVTSSTIYYSERIWERMFKDFARNRRRPWGLQVSESTSDFDLSVKTLSLSRCAWMRGYWQSEKYFDDCRSEISAELTPISPTEERFLELGREMRSANSVAVGVRLFEEVPVVSGQPVTSITKPDFYREAAMRLIETVKSPIFYVFCTKRFPILDHLELPGPIRFVTHDEGFVGAVPRLWLITQCRHHVVSHSSFYWWGAWLSEQQYSDSLVVASRAFPGNDALPDRWLKVTS